MRKGRTRPIRISIRLSAQEHERLMRMCADSGLPVSVLVRDLLMGVAIKPRPPDSYRDLARELAAIGNNINQIARLSNAAGRVSPVAAQQAEALMRQVWELVQARV